MDSLTIGSAVKINLEAGAFLMVGRRCVTIREATTLTGRVTKAFANGRVMVAVDQFPNRSADARTTVTVNASKVQVA